MSHARICAMAAAFALGLCAPAQARVIQAESILPPGQSGYVSVPGVASGTGSPHLTDQISPFVGFTYKSAMFNQPGRTTNPRAGVNIVRDSYGVPAVTGASDYDAWWGIGYAVAEDRLFQIELFRRATSGRLAEILGPDYLDDDLIARRDYYTDAEVDAQIAKIPPNLRQRFEGYRDGVNAYVARTRQDPSLVPGEFPALGITPQELTLRDGGRIGVFLARTVPSGDGVEIDNARALKNMGSGPFRDLLPLRNKGRITSVPKQEGVFPSQPGRTHKQTLQAFERSEAYLRDVRLPPETPSQAAGGTTGHSAQRFIGRTGGSYMWAISTARYGRKNQLTKPGQAFLFNGPQLGYSIPELFVEFELHSPAQNLRGVSAAGIPLLGIGHNGRVAWGFTSGLSDEDDLYVEQLAGAERYRFRGEVRNMDCRDERFDFRTPAPDVPDALSDIITKGRPVAGSRTERICRTVHGPVQARAEGVAFARKYAIWGREIESLAGLTMLNDAKSIQDVDKAMQEVTWNENVLAADDRGQIGYWHPGLHPLRPKDWDERLPYPGQGQAEWRGLLVRRKTPYVINPRQRFLFNWNNMPSWGWTNGDSEARERATGPFHRSRWLRLLVGTVKRKPSYEASRRIDIALATTAQQRPFYKDQLRRAQRAATGRARRVIDTLLAWDGSYARVDGAGTVHPGVALWEEFKSKAEGLVLAQRHGRRHLSGRTGNSHQFDITLGEAYALQRLTPGDVVTVADQAGEAMTARFRTDVVEQWREKRRLYEVAAQGGGSSPDLPFFDRGTWEQSVWLGP